MKNKGLIIGILAVAGLSLIGYGIYKYMKSKKDDKKGGGDEKKDEVKPDETKPASQQKDTSTYQSTSIPADQLPDEITKFTGLHPNIIKGHAVAKQRAWYAAGIIGAPFFIYNGQFYVTETGNLKSLI